MGDLGEISLRIRRSSRVLEMFANILKLSDALGVAPRELFRPWE
jgi:hypothetical protein